MDLLFYVAMGLITLASVAGFAVISYLIGKRNGAKDYYKELTTPNQEERIQ